MPCDSRVINTSMTNAERLAEALADAGFRNIHRTRDGLQVTADGIYFSRSSTSEGFSTSSTRDTGGIGRAYAARGAREFARRAGWSVTNVFEDVATGGLRMRLTNRRGS